MQNPTIDTSANYPRHSKPVPAEAPRSRPRYLLNLAITMRGDNNFYRGLSDRITDEGIFIATYCDLPIGTPVIVSFTLPRSTKPILVLGTVRWVRGPDASARREDNFGREFSEVKPGMGIQFDDVDSDAVHEIQRFMHCRAPEFFD